MNKNEFVQKTAAAAFVLTMFCAVSTAAYLSDHDEAGNILIPGFVETNITEEFPDPEPVPDHETTTLPKVVSISNPALSEAACDCFVRARISFSDSDIGNALTLHFPSSDIWVRNPDGFYYYTEKLSPGESTKPLIDSVTIDPSMIPASAKERLDHFDINIYEESVQAGGFDEYTEAWMAFGV